MIMTYANIEDLAENILKEYLGALPDDAAHVRSIDIEAFASRFLGLNVAYTRLSDSGDILGLTTYADIEIELERYMGRQVIRVAKNTVLIDESLIEQSLRPDRGRRRFTISHECAHQILYRQETEEQQLLLLKRFDGRSYSLRELITKDDWCEWQANALGAALIMPSRCIELMMGKLSGGRALTCYEKRTLSLMVETSFYQNEADDVPKPVKTSDQVNAILSMLQENPDLSAHILQNLLLGAVQAKQDIVLNL